MEDEDMKWSYQILMPGIPVSSPRGALGWCNVVLITSDGRNILFDTGSYGDRSFLLEQLQKQDLTTGDIDLVFVSHFHYDHIVNAELFNTAEILISDSDYRYAVEGGFETSRDPYVPITHIASLKDQLTTVSDGQHIAEGLKAVSLPGHTPGNMGLLLEEEGVILTGDAVKNGWDWVRNTAPPSFYSQEASLESYKKVKSLAEVVVPGHDRPFRWLGDDKIQYLEHHSAEINLYGDPYGDIKKLTLP
jgi:glyoxylase-like metal-dependent hydrolase (beta-lactamase superfamily II)